MKLVSMLRRWLPLVAVSVALLHAVPACMSDSSDTRLNPQPLPPGDPDEVGEPSTDNGGSSGGMSPGGADAGASAADAGADAADAADSGDDQ